MRIVITPASKIIFPHPPFCCFKFYKTNEHDIQFGIQDCRCVGNGNQYYLNHTSVFPQLCGRRAESRTIKEVGNDVCEVRVYVLN